MGGVPRGTYPLEVVNAESPKSLTAVYESPLGKILLAGDGVSLTGLWFEGQKYYAATLPGGSAAAAAPAVAGDLDLPAFRAARAWLDAYFAGERPDDSDVPLAPQGSAFRQSVWRALREIPYGEVTTYGAIARRIGCASARAVGGAVGHNPVSLIIPCHRVVGADGSLTGYAAGTNRKAALLELEKTGLLPSIFRAR